MVRYPLFKSTPIFLNILARTIEPSNHKKTGHLSRLSQDERPVGSYLLSNVSACLNHILQFLYDKINFLFGILFTE
jgi:hypothetical protein